MQIFQKQICEKKEASSGKMGPTPSGQNLAQSLNMTEQLKNQMIDPYERMILEQEKFMKNQVSSLQKAIES